MNAFIYLLRFAVIGVGICGIIIAAFSITPTYKINYIDYSDQSDEKHMRSPFSRLACTLHDAEFADLMDTFLNVMKNAHADGGLYVDGVVSKSSE